MDAALGEVRGIEMGAVRGEAVEEGAAQVDVGHLAAIGAEEPFTRPPLQAYSVSPSSSSPCGPLPRPDAKVLTAPPCSRMPITWLWVLLTK